MKYKTGFTLLIILLITNLNYTQNKLDNVLSEENIRSFNELIGTWECKGISRNQDGSWKTDTTHSTWVWFELFNGNAVQDIFYGGVSPSQIDTAKSGGTNIRIYNPEGKKWHMAWFDTNNRTIQVFTATADEEVIIMEGENAQGRTVRNYFSEISDSFFLWTQKWTFDEGETWVDVAKLWCSKSNM